MDARGSVGEVLYPFFMIGGGSQGNRLGIAKKIVKSSEMGISVRVISKADERFTRRHRAY